MDKYEKIQEAKNIILSALDESFEKERTELNQGYEQATTKDEKELFWNRFLELEKVYNKRTKKIKENFELYRDILCY